MKSIVMSVLTVIAMTAVANAQTDKGDWMVGGDMIINTTSGNSQFTLQPKAGYFFANNFAAGAEFLLGFAKSDQTKSSAVGVGPFARYYFNISNDHFKPLVEGSFGVQTQTDKGPNYKDSYTVSNFFVGGGAAYFINNNVALEALAGYNNSKVENTPASGGFKFRIGFQVHLLGNEVRRK
jgi:uncharacterized protein YaiE (UPF0345 family)